MTGVVFTYSLDATVASDQLAGIEAFFADLTPPLHAIGAEGEQSTVDRFDSNVAPDGTPWKPSLRAQVQGGPTLVQDRHLADSIHYQLDGSDAVEWGSNLVYAAIHQAGGTIHAKGGGALSFVLATGARVTVQSVEMPARPYLGISQRDEAEILDIVSDHITRAAQAGAGGG